jgi:23S rRNA-/tRNA-specific pseudouridylate synthase
MTATTTVADNPCWGGPEPHQHSLPYLLEQIGTPPTDEGSNNHKPLILYKSSQYLVLNKPPDLRMYGAHASTVHKLMTYWYPPPPLLSQPTGTTNTLLNKIASLTNFNDVKDNPIRPCHQLDYATSGVLLFALTKQAAAAACRAFADRSTQKQYVAVVHGHILPQTILDLPKISSETLERSFQSHEAQYRQVRRKQPTDDTTSVSSFDGFMRPCDIFLRWQSMMLKRARQQQSTSTSIDNDDAHNNVAMWGSLETLTEAEQETLLTLKWSNVKKNKRWKDLFETVGDCYNGVAREQVAASTPEKESLPTLFQLDDDETDTFYIHAPISKLKNDFRMMVEHPTATSAFEKYVDTTALDYKPALTKCVVMWRGQYRGSPVSKVLLEPWTGRRHQLRLHMLVAGHAILGDVTYEPPHLPNLSVSRMCLHAQSLILPLLGNERTKNHTTTTTQIHSFSAPDPFPILPSLNGEHTVLIQPTL